MTYDMTRTLSVVRELANGEQLTLKDGYILAMGEDMSIGFLFVDQHGKESVSGLSTMDLCQLNKILNKNDIGLVFDASYSKSKNRSGV